MDVRERVNFINTVGSPEGKKCPKCGTENVEEAMFCASCGTSLKSEKSVSDSKESKSEPLRTVPESKSEPERTVPESKSEPLRTVPESKSELMSAEPDRNSEPESTFAKGLPEWDMVPPQVMIRRKGMRS